jgi:hypothetical protein
MPNTSGLKRGGSRGRPPGALNKATREIRDAARLMLDRPEYRESLQKRLDAGKAPHMELLLHHYAFGKPKEQLDVDARLTGHTTIVMQQLPDAPVVQPVLKSPDPEKP